MPTIGTEWIVEARSGGKCVVRVVHSLFASTDDWDNQLESVESGWPFFFKILRLYLAHFRGQQSGKIAGMAFSQSDASTAWSTLTRPLGLGDAAAGQRWSAPAGLPSAAGVVEEVGSGAPDDAHSTRGAVAGSGLVRRVSLRRTNAGADQHLVLRQSRR